MANEKRLIDANALIRRVCTERDSIEINHACDIGYHNGLNMAVSMTINAPTVDAVEVVRCKDCKFWGGQYASNECSKITKLAHPYYWLKTSPEDFCSIGERKYNGY